MGKGIVNVVVQHLFRTGEHGGTDHAATNIQAHRHVPFVTQRLPCFDAIRGQGAQFYESGFDGTTFRSGNYQQPFNDVVQSVYFFFGQVQSLFRGHGVGGDQFAGALESQQERCQRGPQLVGCVRGEGALLTHQRFDAVGHPIKSLHQGANFFCPASLRDSAAEIAGTHRVRLRLDHFQWSNHQTRDVPGQHQRQGDGATGNPPHELCSLGNGGINLGMREREPHGPINGVAVHDGHRHVHELVLGGVTPAFTGGHISVQRRCHLGSGGEVFAQPQFGLVARNHRGAGGVQNDNFGHVFCGIAGDQRRQ